jgi:hypothetical protein
MCRQVMNTFIRTGTGMFRDDRFSFVLGLAQYLMKYWALTRMGTPSTTHLVQQLT